MYACERTLEGWQLFSEDPKSGRAARDMSQAMTELVMAAKERLEKEPLLSEVKLAHHVRDEMYKVMSRFYQQGAGDTESENALCDELEDAFGLERGVVSR